MKRIGAILTTAALLVTLATSVCFASSLTVEETYPKDDSKGASVENLGVKVRFSENLSEDIVGEANKGAFQLYDEEGKKLPTKVLYNEKEKGVVLVLLDNTKKDKVIVKGNTEYTLKISGDLVDDKGDTLGKDAEINFTTLNQNTNTMISMGMMVLMVGGMVIISSRSAKKAAEENNKRKDEKVNPYKEAKKTGKSVEEIVEKDKKKKAKQEEKAVKAEAEEEADYEDDINKYRVSRRHSASEVGSKYVAAKKEASKKARAQGAKNKTASKGKKKKK